MADHLLTEIVYHSVRFPVRRPSHNEMPTSDSGIPLCGQYDGNALCLKVRADLAPAQAWATLLHEVCHHSLEAAGDAHLEGAEGLCDWFGWAVIDLLVQNPELQDCLLKDMAGAI